MSRSDFDSADWELAEDKPRRPSIVAWLIILLLICSLLLPLVAPFLREFYLATRPTPTPVLPLKVAWLTISSEDHDHPNFR